MRTEDKIMELYNKHEVLVYATVQKRFGNPSYRISHGLTEDDLIQYGRIGLFNACKSYDQSKSASFKSHAINNIIWSIQDEAKKDSLNNINSSSNELLNKTSMDALVTFEYGEEVSLHDVIECKDAEFDAIENESFFKNIGNTISKDLEEVVRLRAAGLSLDEIGIEMNTSKQAVSQLLRYNREKIIRLYQGA